MTVRGFDGCKIYLIQGKMGILIFKNGSFFLLIGSEYSTNEGSNSLLFKMVNSFFIRRIRTSYAAPVAERKLLCKGEPAPGDGGESTSSQITSTKPWKIDGDVEKFRRRHWFGSTTQTRRRRSNSFSTKAT